MTDVFNPAAVRSFTAHAHRTPAQSIASALVAAKLTGGDRGNSSRRHPSSAYVADPMHPSFSTTFAKRDLLGFLQLAIWSACAAHASCGNFAHDTGTMYRHW